MCIPSVEEESLCLLAVFLVFFFLGANAVDPARYALQLLFLFDINVFCQIKSLLVLLNCNLQQLLLFPVLFHRISLCDASQGLLKLILSPLGSVDRPLNNLVVPWKNWQWVRCLQNYKPLL